MKTTSLVDGGTRSNSKSLGEQTRNDTSREAISRKYAARREQQSRQASNMNSTDKEIAPLMVSSSDAGNSQNPMAGPSVLASRWESMKVGFQRVKSIGAKKFLPLGQIQEMKHVTRVSSSESLDEIFQRLKRPTVDKRENTNDDEDN